MKTPRVGTIRFSFSAKKSSVAYKTLPPYRSAAKSVSAVNAGDSFIISVTFAKAIVLYFCFVLIYFDKQSCHLLLFLALYHLSFAQYMDLFYI